MSLTTEEKICQRDTLEHIKNVNRLIHLMIRELLDRADRHDDSKLESPELEAFTVVNHELSGLTYGSPEFNESKKKLGPALSHHYANNSHHPEHYKRGISDMNLIDLLEMFCDWKASGMRHNDGNLLKSIEINAARFNIPSELKDILENTAKLID